MVSDVHAEIAEGSADLAPASGTVDAGGWGGDGGGVRGERAVDARVRREARGADASGGVLALADVEDEFYDELGCCLLAKRLAKGTFRILLSPADDGAAIELTRAELASLLSRAEIVERSAPRS